MKTLNTKNFIFELNQCILHFLNEELSKISGFQLELGFGDSEATSKKAQSLWSRISTKSFETAFLQAFRIERSEKVRKTSLSVEEIKKDGESVFLSRRSPETVEVSYLVYGPRFTSSSGQALYSALFTIFFDHLQLSSEQTGVSDPIKLTDLVSNQEQWAKQALQESGITQQPIYLFQAKTRVSSGKIISEDQRVTRRQLYINSNNNKLGGIK